MFPRVAAVVVAFLALVVGAAAQQTKAPARATKQSLKVEPFAKGLVHPWSLAVLPDRRLLVTERPGRLRLIGKDGKLSAPIKGVPDVAAAGQGGLLDVVLSPDFSTSGLIFLSYAERREGGGTATTVARAKLVREGDSGRLDELKVIFRQEPKADGTVHFGSRIVPARDGNLFITLGERGQRDKAQDLSTHYGKVVRIKPDGSVPPDNPFVKQAGARSEIWSYGHRNLQGAALHPTTGKLWTVEHGARGGDEINIPLAGKNYGWPVITYGRDYTGFRIGEGTAKAGLEQPVYYWDPSIAPSGLAFYMSDRIPEWKGSLLVGALRGQALHRLVLDGEKVVGEEVLLADQGERIRDVTVGPDGTVWLLTDSSHGRVVRLGP
jgi:glucose/arabinose dehydrogenase